MISLPDILLPKIRHFGLSIERSRVHAIEFISASKSPKLASSPLSPDVFTSAGLAKPEILAESIRKVVSQANIRTPYVAVTFPEVFAYGRAVTLPNLEPHEMHEAIIWRIKELFPLPEEEIYFDWKILSREQTETVVNVVAIQRKILDPLVDILIKCGLKPLRFEPDASALARLLVIPKERFALLTEINSNGTYMTLVQADKAVFTSIVSHTQEESPEAYLKNINQGLEEVVAFYRSKGMLTDSNIDVVVTGEMGTNEWAAHISKLLGYPASVLKSKIQETSYFKAYAAASSEITPPDDIYSINVLSKNLQVMYERDRKEKLGRLILGRSIYLTGFFSAVSLIAAGALFLEKYRLDSQINLEKQVKASAGVSVQKITDLNQLAKSIVTLNPLRKTPQEALLTLNSSLTDAISITQWNYNDSKFEFHLTGTAATRDDLLAFKNRLEEEEMFDKVTLPLGSLETPVLVPFTISFVWLD